MTTPTKAQPALDLKNIAIIRIAPDPRQPRKTFNKERIAELGKSLAAGQTTAIRVRARKADDDVASTVEWILMHGERRLRAAAVQGLTRLRAEIDWRTTRDDHAKILLGQITENLQREDLPAVEMAAAIRDYSKLTKLSGKEIAAQLGKNPMYVSLAASMEKLPPKVAKQLDGDVTWKHIRQLVRLNDHPESCEHVFGTMQDQGMNAGALEREVDWELQQIERERRQAEAERKRDEAIAAGDNPPPAPSLHTATPEQKKDRLDKARLTRARKELIRDQADELAMQIKTLAKTIKLPDGMALALVGRISGGDLWSMAPRTGTGNVRAGGKTNLIEEIAGIIVTQLPGEWKKGMGSAVNAGGWAEDDEAATHWLAFALWVATSTDGFDKVLDKAAADNLRDQDKDKAVKAKSKAKADAAAAAKKIATTEATAAAARAKKIGDRLVERLAGEAKARAKAKKTAKSKPKTPAADIRIECGRDGCGEMFHVKHGKGRRFKNCPKHRSK